MIGQLSPYSILIIVAGYFAVLVALSWWLNREGSSNDDFFLAGRKSPWPLVAFGMIGASLSGVTFISVPGAIGAGGLNQAFSYMQVVFGYLLGYLVIATVLLPLYYRMGLTSIYEYLDQRLGRSAYKIGAFYFLLSRTIGASFRLFLVAIVLQQFVTGPLGLPFIATVAITILLIWLYTFQGGIKTIVYTDALQTLSMIIAVILTISFIGDALETDLSGLVGLIKNSDYSQVFFFEGGWSDPNNFFKQFFAGALITIVMTGLDQDMMQKNISISNVRDSQKNMALFSVILVFANVLFVGLGALLYIYAANFGLEIPARTDQLYPTIALNHLPAAAGIFFIIGLIAAAYSSADSALTALTTSFSVDMLDIRKRDDWDEAQKRRVRRYVHMGFSVLLLVVIMLFQAIADEAVINSLFKAAGYTYGPLLGLFCYGLFTNLRVREYVQIGSLRLPVLVVLCLAAPVISFFVDYYSAELLNGFEFGFLILAFNGLLTFAGLLALSDDTPPLEEED
ncbi:sodium:solute symporter [Lewinellaceae bacterium SD302]|nr:sodium:solute symporter [Lewinellaceae bacterium SD302]